jgi:hypothetical protein
MKKNLVVTLAIAIGAIVSPVAHAEGLVEPASGVSFEKHPSSDGKSFVCLAAGIRKYLFWKVYAMDFCVEEEKLKSELDRYFAGPGKRHAALEGRTLATALGDDRTFFDFLASSAIEKRAELVFLRDSDADTVRNSFRKNLEKGIGSADQEKAAIGDFVSAIDRDVKVGDRARFVTRPGELSFTWGTNSRTLKHSGVEAAFWRGYLGPDSPLPSLKDAVAQGIASLRR